MKNKLTKTNNEESYLTNEKKDEIAGLAVKSSSMVATIAKEANEIYNGIMERIETDDEETDKPQRLVEELGCPKVTYLGKGDDRHDTSCYIPTAGLMDCIAGILDSNEIARAQLEDGEDFLDNMHVIRQVSALHSTYISTEVELFYSQYQIIRNAFAADVYYKILDILEKDGEFVHATTNMDVAEFLEKANGDVFYEFAPIRDYCANQSFSVYEQRFNILVSIVWSHTIPLFFSTLNRVANDMILRSSYNQSMFNMQLTNAAVQSWYQTCMVRIAAYMQSRYPDLSTSLEGLAMQIARIGIYDTKPIQMIDGIIDVYKKSNDQ